MIRGQHECTDFSSADVISAMDRDNREVPTQRVCYRISSWLTATMHGRDRATKHEHQAQCENDFADDVCFHISYFDVFMFRLSLQC